VAAAKNVLDKATKSFASTPASLATDKAYSTWLSGEPL
jgi:hypothetical protein